jgi:hypothetical protein
VSEPKNETPEIKRILDETDRVIAQQRRERHGPDPIIAESMRKLTEVDPETLEAYLRYTGALTLSAPERLQ